MNKLLKWLRKTPYPNESYMRQEVQRLVDDYVEKAADETLNMTIWWDMDGIRIKHFMG